MSKSPTPQIAGPGHDCSGEGGREPPGSSITDAWKTHSIVYPDVSSGGVLACSALRSGWCALYRACMKMPGAGCLFYCNLSKEFSVKGGVHRGSCLKPLLFITVLEALSQKFRTGKPVYRWPGHHLWIAGGTSNRKWSLRSLPWKVKDFGSTWANWTKVLISGPEPGMLQKSSKDPGGRLNINMSSHQYRGFPC